MWHDDRKLTILALELGLVGLGGVTLRIRAGTTGNISDMAVHYWELNRHRSRVVALNS
jgi:hypothetical protein